MTKIIDSDYIHKYDSWANIKKDLLKKYQKLYGNNISITRVKSDTKGLYSFFVEAHDILD